MQLGDPRHQQLVRYFGGEFGELYDDVLLLGAQEVGRVELLSHVALYAEPDGVLSCRFVSVTEDAPQRAEVIAELQTLTIDEQQVYTRLFARQGAVGPEGEQFTIDLANRLVGKFDLPLAFVTWMRLFSSGHTKIILWYPKLAPGAVLLGVLQRTARKVFPV